jgi:hypothetical protein
MSYVGTTSCRKNSASEEPPMAQCPYQISWKPSNHSRVIPGVRTMTKWLSMTSLWQHKSSQRIMGNGSEWLSHLMNLSVHHVGVIDWMKIKQYWSLVVSNHITQYWSGVVSNHITSIPNLIKIHPAILELFSRTHDDRNTSDDVITSDYDLVTSSVPEDNG